MNLQYILLSLLLVTIHFSATAQSSSTPQPLAIYYAYPSSVNGAATINEAVDAFDDYEVIVFADPLQFPQPTGAAGEDPYWGCGQNRHYDHDNTSQIITALASMGKQVFGYVSIGGSNTNWICNGVPTPLVFEDTTRINPLDPLGVRGDIVSRIDRWEAMGVTGIFLDEAGYDFGTDRARQTQTIDYIHNDKNMPVFINAWNPEDILTSNVHPSMNPSGAGSSLGANDIVLLESYVIINGHERSVDDWRNRADDMLRLSDSTDVDVATVTTSTYHTCETGGFDAAAQAQFDHAWWATYLYNFEYMGWGEGKNYSTTEQDDAGNWTSVCNAKLSFHTRPQPTGTGDDLPSITVGRDFISNTHTRFTTKGVIQVDANTNTGSFIPAPAPNSSATIPATFSSWWASEGNGIDQIGSNDGTPTASSFVPGVVGQAFSFNGVDEMIAVGTGASLNGTGTFTIEAWIKTNQDGIIIQQRDGSAAGYDGQYILSVGGIADFAQTAGSICLGTYADYSYGLNFCGTTNVADGNFHHIAAVRESDGTGKIYVDGVLDHSQSASPSNLKTREVYIGADMRNWDKKYFKGVIDELTIMESALSATDVQAIYNAGNGGKCLTECTIDPVSYWSLDEGAGTTANDSFGSNTGTLRNAPGWTSGKMGHAVHFDGIDDYVDISVTPDLQFDLDDVTFEAWIKSDRLGAGGSEIIAGQYYSYPIIHFRIANDGSLASRIGFSPSQNFELAGGGPALTDGNWHHVAVVFDRDGLMTRYVDGVAYGTTTDISSTSGLSLDAPNAFSRRFRIGASGSTATLTQLFDGIIDEVKVYRAALTPAEIQARFEQGNGQASAANAGNDLSLSTNSLFQDVPETFSLEGNYPNPFNPTTTIRFVLPDAAVIRLVVYDVQGREVDRLADGQYNAGTHEVMFDASRLASGSYYSRLETPEGSQVKKMVLIK